MNNRLLKKLMDNPVQLVKATSLLMIPLLLMVQTIFAEESKPGLIRAILMENPVELPSKNINAKVIKVTFPPAFKTPWHTHDAPGPRYVLKGKLKVTEDGKVNTYSVGEVFWESGKLMAVENVGKEAAELIIVELATQKK
jgi:quercetin dioxygenase-like cupin family protein